MRRRRLTRTTFLESRSRLTAFQNTDCRKGHLPYQGEHLYAKARYDHEDEVTNR